PTPPSGTNTDARRPMIARTSQQGARFPTAHKATVGVRHEWLWRARPPPCLLPGAFPWCAACAAFTVAFRARETGQSVARLEAVARLMDSQFLSPGTNLRIGLDPLVGLIAVVGDLISGLVSTCLIWEVRRLGAPRRLIARMMANTLLDTAVG